MGILSNLFGKKKQTKSKKSEHIEDKKNQAFIVYCEFGPNLKIPRIKRLTSIFPDIEETTLLNWINEFKEVNERVWEFAKQIKVTKHNRESFSVAFNPFFPWMNAESLNTSWGRMVYYIVHEGYDK
jgi:hypothetical protein